MKSALLAIAITLVIVAIGVVILLPGRAPEPTSPSTTNPPPEATPDPGWDALDPLPPFNMTDQNGQTVDESILEGGVTILTFFFTHCQSVCPFMNGSMFELTQQLAGTPVRFVSVSVDPENDTTEVLRAYADKWGVPDERWKFLSADQETLDRIVRDAIGFDLSYKDELLDVGGGRQVRDIQHPGALLLIGPDRRVLGKYQYQWADDVSNLAARARVLADYYR